MLRYGYFDSEITGTDSEGMPIFDRAETSDLFRLLFANLLTNGVLASPANCFQVMAGASGLTVTIKPGFGMVKGAFAYDENDSTLSLETAPTQYSRIDRVVLRCNYVDRCVEIIVKTGTPAATPTAPELIRPASGDYYELGLALITINANQTVISQAQITDTRADSSVCGFITQFIDSIDTSVFYAQFNAFYADFVARSDATYEEFTTDAQEAFAEFQDLIDTAYNNFNDTLDDYIEALEARGDSQVTDIVTELSTFKRTAMNDFLSWFATVQGLLDEDIAGRLINITNDHENRLLVQEYMNRHNDYFAPIADDDGYTIVDDNGYAIMVDWAYTYK